MPKTSDVWQHFTRVTDDDGKYVHKARCNYCTDKKEFETKAGTSNMKRHVKKFHPQEAAAAAAAAEGAPAAQQPQPLPYAASGSMDRESRLKLNEDEAMQMMLENQCVDVEAAPVFSGQEGAAQAQPQPTPLPRPCAPSPQGPAGGGSSDRRPGLQQEASKHLTPGSCALSQERGIEEANRDLARMIALHGLDPSIVEDKYFRAFVRRLNPGFKLPSRQYIEKMCADVFTESWEKVARFLNPNVNEFLPGRFSIGVGKAKTMAGEALHYVTYHYIDNQWILHRVVMDAYVVLFSSPHLDDDDNDDGCYVYLSAVTVLPLHFAVERVATDILRDQTYYLPCPFMIAGEIMGHIDYIRLKDYMEQQIRLTCNYKSSKPLLICATYMDHVLHSIAQCFLSYLFPGKEFSIACQQHYIPYCPELVSKLDLDEPWEYNECWYWLYYCLEINGQQYEMDEDDKSDSQETLINLWRKIYRAIKRVSASDTPTSNLCLRQLFKVRHALQSELSKATKDMSNDSGDEEDADLPLRKALKAVDKAIEDSYQVWSIPLVLDPRYKLSHIEENFKKIFDDSKATNYTSQVTRKITELYTSYIEDDKSEVSRSDDEMMAADSSNPSEQASYELRCYLQDSPARRTKDFDILNWWKVSGLGQYPTLARMARDALAMPTCSKLTSDQIAHVRSMLRGYSRRRYE